MRTLPENSIPLIIADPPYGISFQGITSDTTWDKIEDLESFLTQFLLEAYRILTPTGTLWICFGPTEIHKVFKAISQTKFTNHLENWSILARSKGRGTKNKLKSIREDVFHLTKHPTKYTWNSIEYLREVVVPFVKDGKARGWTLDSSTGLRVRYTGLGNVMFFTMPSFNSVTEKQIHSCQKPLLFWISLIMMSSKKGDTVFDPFLGSGSSGIAALLSERNFIGCETDKEMFAKAQNWLNSIQDPKTEKDQKSKSRLMQDYIKKHISSSEKDFIFSDNTREILPKKLN